MYYNARSILWVKARTEAKAPSATALKGKGAKCNGIDNGTSMGGTSRGAECRGSSRPSASKHDYVRN